MALPFTYHAASHTYKLAGRPIPGITTVLSHAGYYKGEEWYTPASSFRGGAGHQACFLLNKYAPDALTLEDALEVVDLEGPTEQATDELRLRVSGYLQYRRESGFVPDRYEFPVCSQRLRIACIPDLWGHYPDNSTGVIELKTWPTPGSKCPRAAELQTEGQALMIEEHLGLKSDRRTVLALTGNPSMPYRQYQCTGVTDRAVVECIAKVWWDRRSAGLLDWSGASETEEAAA